MFSRQIDELMQAFKYEGLTFDDISLITQYADFLPADTSVKTRFTRNVTLNIPFVSAAMDTVTESSMAIAMARLGGIGVIHKNLSIERQSESKIIFEWQNKESCHLQSGADNCRHNADQARTGLFLLRLPDCRS